MTRIKALKIIKDHGFKSNQNTAWQKRETGELMEVPRSSFDDELGIKPEYSRSEVYNWLGY